MNRRYRRNLESLEGRSLLSGLSVSLTTDQPVYHVGQPVQIDLVETNNTSKPITVDEGPSIDGFIVEQAGVTMWRSNAGINPQIILANTVQSGQSFTLKTTWNGIPNGSSKSVTGTFEVNNELTLNVAPATFQIEDSSTSTNPAPSPAPTTPAPAAPIQNPVTPTPVAPTLPISGPPVSVSVSTDRGSYKPGQSVRLTMTLENVSARALTLVPNASVDGFTLSDGSTVIWHSHGAHRFTPRTLQSGQSITLTSSWNGRPNHEGARKLAPGTYTIQAVEGGYAGSATISIM